MPINVNGLCGVFLVVAAIVLGVQATLMRLHDLSGAELCTLALGHFNAMVGVLTCGHDSKRKGFHHRSLWM